MPRMIWTGAISFGLVTVPVGLYAATEDKTVHFHNFQKGTSDRVRNQRVNERTGKEVDYDDVVKGYDLGGGDYVVLTQEELESVEPGRSRTIDISDFVDLDEIDPMFYQKTYYVAPRGEEAARPYALLREAMAATNKVGIATFVMRGKQYLVSLRPDDDVLVLETMFFADEIRDPAADIDDLPRRRNLSSRDVATAKQLVDSMAVPWDPEQYHDTYRERVEDLIRRKRKGEGVVEREEPREEKVTDLMEALRASVDAARSRGKRGGNDLSRLPKAELSKQAAKLDIPGRSKMSRDQLAEAIEKAAGGARRRAS